MTARSMIEPGVAASDLDAARVLYVGQGATAVCWYRCALPALFMGADWCGVAGQASGPMRLLTGLVKGNTTMPDFYDYDVVVLQQPRAGWTPTIKRMRARGITVLFEVDDYVHGIRKMSDHDFSRDFGKAALGELELNMRLCDGLIVSTEWLAAKYRRFNPRVWVCENGVDLGRYALTRPFRPKVNVGWAGGTGHGRAAAPWVQAVSDLMADRDDLCFVSIGQPFADAVASRHPGRALATPFTMVDTYPSAMTMFDVAIAPAGDGTFFRGKSDLRWVEAGALGIPTIADPRVYSKIEHGVDGFHASSPAEAAGLVELLLDEPELRTAVGEAARTYVKENRDMRVAVRAWERALSEARS